MGCKKIWQAFRFTDDLIALNDGNEFQNQYNEIYPLELISKKGNTSHRETTFLDFHFCVNEGQIQTSKFKFKRKSYNFNVMRFPYKSGTIPSKMFFATISAESVEQMRLWYNLFQHLKFFYIKC